MHNATSPGALVIKRFGGIRPLARKLTEAGMRTDPSSVARWKKSRGMLGTGGQIPSKYHGALLDLAKRENIYLTAEELIRGSDS